MAKATVSSNISEVELPPTHSASLLPTMLECFTNELSWEFQITHQLLQNLTTDSLGYKVTPTSITLGRRAIRLAQIPTICFHILHADTHDANNAPEDVEPQFKDQIIKLFAKNSEQALTLLKSYDNQELQKDWTFTHGAKKLFSLPRGYVLRTWGYGHLIHYRAQLQMVMRLAGLETIPIYVHPQKGYFNNSSWQGTEHEHQEIRKQEKHTIAKKLLDSNQDAQFISKVTGLTCEEVMRLLKAPHRHH